MCHRQEIRAELFGLIPFYPNYTKVSIAEMMYPKINAGDCSKSCYLAFSIHLISLWLAGKPNRNSLCIKEVRQSLGTVANTGVY